MSLLSSLKLPLFLILFSSGVCLTLAGPVISVALTHRDKSTAFNQNCLAVYFTIRAPPHPPPPSRSHDPSPWQGRRLKHCKSVGRPGLSRPRRPCQDQRSPRALSHLTSRFTCSLCLSCFCPILAAGCIIRFLWSHGVAQTLSWRGWHRYA